MWRGWKCRRRGTKETQRGEEENGLYWVERGGKGKGKREDDTSKWREYNPPHNHDSPATMGLQRASEEYPLVRVTATFVRVDPKSEGNGRSDTDRQDRRRGVPVA